MLRSNLGRHYASWGIKREEVRGRARLFGCSIFPFLVPLFPFFVGSFVCFSPSQARPPALRFAVLHGIMGVSPSVCRPCVPCLLWFVSSPPLAFLVPVPCPRPPCRRCVGCPVLSPLGRPCRWVAPGAQMPPLGLSSPPPVFLPCLLGRLGWVVGLSPPGLLPVSVPFPPAVCGSFSPLPPALWACCRPRPRPAVFVALALVPGPRLRLPWGLGCLSWVSSPRQCHRPWAGVSSPSAVVGLSPARPPPSSPCSSVAAPRCSLAVAPTPHPEQISCQITVLHGIIEI